MTTKEFFSKFMSKYLLGNIFAMFMVTVLLFTGVVYGLDLYTHHGQGISVPNLKGMNYNDALRILEERGLKIVVSDSGFNRKLPADCILAQTPGAGVKVKDGHTVYVTVNSPSSPMLTIPDLIDNSSLREAQAKLSAMGFRLLDPEYVHGEKDWLYGIKSRGRSLYAGDNVSADIPLVLQVGDGQFDSNSDDINYTDPNYNSDEGGDKDDFEEVGGPDTPEKSSSHPESKKGNKSGYKDKVDESGLNDF